MSWELIVALKILAGSVLAPIAFRLLGNVPTRERVHRILLQYALAVGFALCVALIWGFEASGALLPIAVIGMLMPLAVFFQWKATAMSVSRTAIFMEGTSVIPLLLSAVMLSEWRALADNGVLMTGFILVALGITLHAWRDIRNKRADEGKDALPASFYVNAVGFTIVFALATFLQNVWAKSDVGVPEFLLAWYGGAFVGSLVFFATTRHLPKAKERLMPVMKERAIIFLAGTSIFLSLGLEFVAFKLVEQIVVLPIFSIGGLLGPALVGMLIFKEWKKLHGWAWVYIGIGFVGALMMVVAR